VYSHLISNYNQVIVIYIKYKLLITLEATTRITQNMDHQNQTPNSSATPKE
jgi:hypothetical protein